MYYQIQVKNREGSWIRDPIKYEHWAEAYEDVMKAKKYNKRIQKIEVVCVEED